MKYKLRKILNSTNTKYELIHLCTDSFEVWLVHPEDIKFCEVHIYGKFEARSPHNFQIRIKLDRTHVLAIDDNLITSKLG